MSTRDGKTLAAIQRTRTSDIWAAPAADSSQARQITSGEPAYDRLAIGPSGKLLAVSRNGDVWLMNSDGTAPAVLVPQATNARSVSSCGDRYVVYDSYRDGKLELWRADADGSNSPEAGGSGRRFRLFARRQVGLLRQQGQGLSRIQPKAATRSRS